MDHITCVQSALGGSMLILILLILCLQFSIGAVIIFSALNSPNMIEWRAVTKALEAEYEKQGEKL